MKLNFTMLFSKSLLVVSTFVLTINTLEAQNAGFDQSQKNSSSASLLMTGKIFAGSMRFAKDAALENIGMIANAQNPDPQSFQFGINQGDLGNLYKLLDEYKSQAEKGNSIDQLRKKKNPGMLNDSFYIANKYVVADDLSGFTTPTNLADFPLVVKPTAHSIDGISQSIYKDKIPASIDNTTSGFGNGLQDISGMVSIYPNPAQNTLNIELGEVQRNEITIYSIQGKLVKTIVSDLNNSLKTIDIADLPSGFYVVNISSPTGTVMKKFSKIN